MPYPCTCGKNELCEGRGDYIMIIMNTCTFDMYFRHFEYNGYNIVNATQVMELIGQYIFL